NLGNIRRVDYYLIADLPNRAIVVGKQRRFGWCENLRLIDVGAKYQREFLSDVFVEQLLGGEQVVFIILLNHRQRVRRSQRFDMYRRRVNLLRDPTKL